MILNNYLKPLRIDHWVKNLVIIFGYIVALLYEPNHTINLKILLLSFFILCISASSNYLINEYLDRNSDRYHPVKKWRYFSRKHKSGFWVLINYFALVSVSIFLSLFTNYSFFMLNIFFLICAIVYNVKPLRMKDVFIFDTLLESINNPVRFLMGWVLVLPNYYPPISIILYLWFVGCFLMTMKRYSEYSFIIKKKIKPELYRISFKKYNLESLFSLSLFYSLISLFFFTIFLIKYKIELLLVVPLVCYLYVYIFELAKQKNSIIMKIEKIYKDRYLIFIIFLISIISLILLKININFLIIFKSNSLIPINFF